MAKRFAGGIALCLALAGPACAAPPTSALIGTLPQPAWSSLTAEQRAILAPLGAEWDGMENYRKKKWLGIAERYSTMAPEEQQRLQKRMRDWAAMTPEQRKKVRDSYKEFKQLPPEKKRAVRQKWETYSRLSDEEKNRIKQDKAASTAPNPATAQTPSATQPADHPTPPASALASPAPTAARP